MHERLVCPPSQDMAVEFANVARVFWTLSAPHREILMLIGVNGLNYEEAANILGCPIGTVRSRLSRARTELQKKINAADSDAPSAEIRALARHLPALLAA